jgi:nucleoside-diphosphate-sugar epimerase
MKPIALYCKSYSTDLRRVIRLAKSIHQFNVERLPFYISVPKAELSLFRENLGMLEVELIADEDILRASSRINAAQVALMPGSISQQVVKSEFWRLGLSQAYVCLDSDALFIRPFGWADFLSKDGDPYTMIDEAHDLLEHALQQKKVRVLDNMVNGFEKNVVILSAYPAFEFMQGDIRDFDTCVKACEGIDYISHQAALGSVPRSIKEPVYFNEVNVGGFVNILKAAVDCKVKTIVYASSSSVYGDEPTLPKVEHRIGNCLSPYAATKKTNELYAQVFADVYGLKIMGFRYFNIFGPRQDPDGPYAAVIPLFVKGIMKETPVYINGDGEQTRDFTFVDNAVQEMRELGGMLVIGSAIAACIQVFVPRDIILGLGQNPLTAILSMLLLAVIVSICSTVDAFFALSFASSFTTSSLLAFLVLGPMIDFKGMGLMLSIFKPRILLYLFAMAVQLTFLLTLTHSYFF